MGSRTARAVLPFSILAASASTVLASGAVAVVGAAATAVPAAAATATIAASQSLTLGHFIRNSSPSVGDVDGVGIDDRVIGGEDGVVRVFKSGNLSSLLWSANAVPHVPAGCNAQSGPTAIDSAPTVADVDGDGHDDVIVGMQSVYVAGQNGGIVVFNGDGSVKRTWTGSHDVFDVWDPNAGLDGWCEGVYATSTVGDVNGDGVTDVVFAGWDHQIWALDGRNGTTISGFPVENWDTVWSSPALADADGDGRDEIFVGGDDTCCWNGHESGGQVHRFDWESGVVVEPWQQRPDEAVMGSPAIGDVDGDGRLELVITTAYNYNTIDTRRIFAYHLDDGSPLPGWPFTADGVVTASPALGDVDGDGVVDVVVGGWDRNVYALRGNGTVIWKTRICCNPAADDLNRINAGAVIGDLDGDGDNDVAVGSGWGLQFLEGKSGAKYAQGSVEGVSADSSPVIADFGGNTRRVVAIGYSLPGNSSTIASYPVPRNGVPPWPAFRGAGNGQPAVAPCPAATPAGSTHAVADPNGYWMLGALGTVYRFGSAVDYGQPAATLPAGVKAVDLEPTPSSSGYWVLDSRGCILNYGDAHHYGNVVTSSLKPGERAVSVSAVGSTGYLVFTNRGRVVAFGSAQSYGDMSAVTLNGPVLGSIVTPSGHGYYMVASDGGIFAFGDATFKGSMGGQRLNQPVQDLVPTVSGQGYWLVASDGGVFAFGDAPFRGSMGGTALNKPVVGMVRYGSGYLMVGSDGGIFSFSERAFKGSLGADPPAVPVVTAAAVS